ncbi:MAG: GNVR domain-containing protein [Chloroflexota bacterium]
MLSLQGNIQRLQNEESRLVANRELAQDTYQALARRAREAKITSQDAKTPIQIASRAQTPVDSVGPPRLLYAGLAAVIGLLLGLAAAFVLDWRHSGKFSTGPAGSTGYPLGDARGNGAA